MSLHCILDSFIASLQCRLSCINAICRMMYCCIASCIMSLHCIPARNNRVLGHCSGKISRTPAFRPSKPPRRRYLSLFVCFCHHQTLLTSRILSLVLPCPSRWLTPAQETFFPKGASGRSLHKSWKRPAGRIPDSSGSCGPLSGKSPEFPFHPRVNSCSSELHSRYNKVTASCVSGRPE